jgi:POT family proton-dependent oligopeptide transporter
MNQTSVPARHPKGLGVLFTTEMWERFNFYGMRAILSLFIAQALAYGDKQSSIIYGGFLGLCYLTPMLGGYISDRFLGNRNCIIFGGITMAIGQLLLFTSASMYSTDLPVARIVLWIALLMVIFGNGFFKPNISSMVGSLYQKGDNRLDSAFTIFYMGINVGAFLGNFICSLVGDVKIGDIRDLSAFKWGFLAAGIAMVLGVAVFYFLKNKYIVTPDGRPIGKRPVFTNSVSETESEKAKFSNQSLILCLVMIAGFTYLFHLLSDGSDVSPIKSWLYPFIYASGISLAILIISDKTITKIERDRILVLYVVCFFVIFFWACFEQAGSSLTFIADQQTDTRIFGWAMPPSQVQNFNAIFIVLLALPFSWLWIQLQKKKLEPISPVKQAFGLILMAIGYFILSTTVKGIGNEQKIGIIFLIMMYLFHTMGELCLSPIGLSLVAKLAPKRFSSLLMGVWFISNAAGYALTGTLGSLLPATGPKFTEAQSKFGINLQDVLDKKILITTDQITQLKDANIPFEYPKFAGFTIHNLYDFVIMFVLLSLIAGILLFILTPMLKKMMHGVR